MDLKFFCLVSRLLTSVDFSNGFYRFMRKIII
jgi:hypothetical protein